MSAVPQPDRTTSAIDEYLARERTAEYKSEFLDGVTYPLHRDAAWNMAGVSRAHNRVNENLSVEVGTRLRGTSCQSFSRDLRVRVSPTGPSYYPDLVVVCGEPEFAAADPDALVNPLVIVEVLSDSTAGYDRQYKFRQYGRLPSFREYVLVAQDAPVVERFVRRDDGTWAAARVEGLAAELAFETIPVRVSLGDVYAGVAFPPGPAGG